MGGFLSAFYAILSFGLIEWKCVRPLLLKMGVPGGVKRYLDDVLIALAWRDKEELDEIRAFLQKMKAMYPPPLVLNMESEGRQEFLEAEVFEDTTGLCTRLLNKVTADIEAGKPDYRRRLAGIEVMQGRHRDTVLDGIIRRRQDYASSPQMFFSSLADLAVECEASCGLGPFVSAIQRYRARNWTRHMEMMEGLGQDNH